MRSSYAAYGLTNILRASDKFKEYEEETNNFPRAFISKVFVDKHSRAAKGANVVCPNPVIARVVKLILTSDPVLKDDFKISAIRPAAKIVAKAKQLAYAALGNLRSDKMLSYYTVRQKIIEVEDFYYIVPEIGIKANRPDDKELIISLDSHRKDSFHLKFVEQRDGKGARFLFISNDNYLDCFQQLCDAHPDVFSPPKKTAMVDNLKKFFEKQTATPPPVSTQVEQIPPTSANLSPINNDVLANASLSRILADWTTTLNIRKPSSIATFRSFFGDASTPLDSLDSNQLPHVWLLKPALEFTDDETDRIRKIFRQNELSKPSDVTIENRLLRSNSMSRMRRPGISTSGVNSAY